MSNLITDEWLSKWLGKTVYWHEVVVPTYLRVHYDRERYLSSCEDIPMSKVNKAFEKQNDD